MKKKIQLQGLLSLFMWMAFSTIGNSQVVISQVYGGGGNSGSTYTNDFIELFNSGTSPVNLDGWSVQYASATGSSWQKTNLTNITLAPGQYYLIQQAQGSGGTTPLPTPDVTGTIPMAAGAGKVVLLSTNILLTAGTICPADATVIDIVGFGTTANCFEGAGSTPAPSNTNAVLRAANGCTDNNNNAADFATGAPNPRNTSAPLNPCTGTPTLSVSVAAGSNAAEPATNGSFSINLSQPAPAGGITVTYSFAGTATLSSDYSDPQSGSIIIPAGATSAQVIVTVIDDAAIEGPETIELTLTTVTSPATIGTATASIGVIDNDFPLNPYIALQTSYTQDFNTLALSGTASSLPTGWLFSEAGTNTNGLYAAGTGSGTGGDTYSFGASGSSDRAFGGLQSGSLIPTIGAQIQNTSGGNITRLKISYTGEQWRLGTVSRTDRLLFQYSLDATDLTNGTWVNVTELDFVTPNVTTVGAKDGNAVENRTEIIYTIRNLAIPDGAVFLIRWSDLNASGADDGLGIDDISIEVNPVDLTPPAIVSLSPANGTSNASLNLTATATFDESILKGTGSIVLKRSSDNGTVQTININDASISGKTVSVTFNNLQVNTSYYIEISSGAITDLEANSFAGISGSSIWAFTTGINVYVADFQNCSGSLSDGFTQYSVVGDVVWACTPFGRDPNAPTGTAQFPTALQINGFSGGTNVPNTDWLISPSFDLTGTDYPLLSFWSRTAFNGQPLQLKVSTDYISGDPSTATWTDINGKFPSQTSNVWTLSENINLSAFKAPNVRFAFVYYSDEDDGARWTIDDVSLSNSPVPPPPSLTVSTTDLQFAFAAGGTTVDKTFSFTGNDLTNDITLTATGAFSLSKDGTSFGPSISYTIAEANNVLKTVFVRFAPAQNNQDFAGNISVVTGDVNTSVSLGGSSIDPATTLEVVNWNIEWFGSTGNGPVNDPQQEQNVKTIFDNLNADVYALTEIVSEERLAAVVSQMPGYTYVISNYGSHTNTSANPPSALATAQKMAFIYKTSVLSNVTTTALLSEGINSAADLTNPAYNYWASGRFPFMLSADVTLNCVTKPVRFVLVHGKANTSPTLTSYNRRKSGADTLHYTLQQNYPTDNVIILGDYNDDLDVTITAGITPPVTSYSIFTNDADNFTAVTLPLSLADKKSTVSYNDVIDHVTVSNELVANYLPGSANILTDVTSLVSNYGSTTSDHYPVFSRFRFSNTTAPTIVSCKADTALCLNTTNNYNIPLFTAADDCGDVITYTYSITGATERAGTGNNASGAFNIGTSVINWTASDSWGNSITCQTTVTVNPNPTVSVPNVFALPAGTSVNTVYNGYAPASSLTLTAEASGGTPAYQYRWSTAATTASVIVSPQTATNYTVTVTDANGCTATADKAIRVVDVRGGRNNNKVLVCRTAGKYAFTLAVSSQAVPYLLAHGATLGRCSDADADPYECGDNGEGFTVKVLPNPSFASFTLRINSCSAEPMRLRVIDIRGRVIEQRSNVNSTQELVLGQSYRSGLYFVELIQGSEKQVVKLLKL